MRHPFLFFTLPLATLASLSYLTIARAQITPDNSLGGENSVVTPNVQIKDTPSDRIDGGAIRGDNLFHSFQEFNINAGRGAYFSNPQGIANILTRVTGGNLSNIQGVLGVLGSANLFLINPNGIIFGPNARLDVNGSFLGSTANSLIFNNNFEFSATNPQAPPLLTINVPIGLGFRNNPGNITTQSTTTQYPILQVPEGKTITLVGGNISLDGGILFAPGGRIELGGLSTAGTVGLNGDGSLSFPVGVLIGDVSLTNRAYASVIGGGGGSIAVNARNLDISGGSFLEAGIGQGLGTVGSQAGDITLNATGEIKVVGSYIFNDVLAQAVGNGGNITISSGDFSLTDGGKLYASTYGQGNAGNVSVRASNSVELAGSVDIFSNVESGGVGKGGNININAATLSLKDGAQLQTSVRGASDTQPGGRGDAGNVTVDVTGPVTIAGVKDGFASAIFSEVGTRATGNGGNITISSGDFFLTDSGKLYASTYGQGNAGNVSVRASNSVELAGSVDIFSNVELGGVGKGGNININAATLSLKDGAQLQTLVRGASDTQPGGRGDAGNITVDVTGPVTITGVGVKDGFVSGIFSNVGTGATGKGGNININAATLSLKDGAQLQTLVRGASDTQPGGRGDAGNVTVDVTGPVTIAGVKDGFASAIFSEVGTRATGNGGNITISSGDFFLTDSGKLYASTYGQGNAGNVSVRASNSVELAGSVDIFSNVESGGVGKGGNININAATLSLKDGAQLQTLVRGASDTQPGGRGDAGNVTVDVTGSVTIAGVKDGFASAIFSNVEAGGVGKGGNININAATLSLKDGAQLQTLVRGASDTQPGGRGDAGNVTVDVTGPVTIAGVKDGFASAIFSRVEPGVRGNGGNITISSGSFSLTDGALLDASTFGQGNAGNVSVRASGAVSLAGSNTRIFSTVERGAVGNGGNININAPRVSLNDGAQITASSTGNGAAGDIEVLARSIRLDNGSTIKADTVAGQGNINLNARDFLLLRRGSKITTDATGLATGGNITINTGNLVAFPQENSDITAKAQESFGGRININANGIFGIEYRAQETPLSDITASSTLGPQFSGSVQINTPDIDPTQGLFELSQAVIDPAQQIAQNPCIKGFGSSFTVVGRGGIPTDPKKILSSDNVRVDLIKLVAITVSSTSTSEKQPSQKPTVKEIIPARGWIYNEKGEVLLVGYDPTKTGVQRQQPAPSSSCAAR